jgi:hypothetical protein
VLASGHRLLARAERRDGEDEPVVPAGRDVPVFTPDPTTNRGR